MSKNKWKFKIQSFAPDEKLKDPVSKMYMKQLKVFMKNKQVRNIAMTGDLGIGKSTLIRNYERKYKKCCNKLFRKKYVYLSVTDMKVKSAGEALQNELEERLLKQLLVICNKEEMIGSHYRPVPEKNVGAIPYILAAIAILLIAWALGILPYASEYTYINIGAAVLASIPLFYLFYKICKHYKLPSFEFNFGGENNNGNAAAEHTEAEETLDKNMTDIVYLMERIYKKSAKVLVVEDLDRYGADICIPIIEKFREINVLVNQRIRFLHGDKEPFRFVYILKDDIFSKMQQDENKSSVPPSKYFDGILPVVPQLGHANSADYLEKHWKKYSIEPDFIYEISKYILDYRQIRAIENEFNIFREVAEKTPNKSTIINNTHFNQICNSLRKKRTINPIKVIKNIRNVCKDINSIKKQNRIKRNTELMALCLYKHFHIEEYYKIRIEREQELITYLIQKTLYDTSKKFSSKAQYKVEKPVLSEQNENTKPKIILAERMSIDILRYIFPNNSITALLDIIKSYDDYLINKEMGIPSFKKMKRARNCLDKTGAYSIDFKLIYSIYLINYTCNEKITEKETIDISDFQRKLWEDCKVNKRLVDDKDAKELFALYYADTLVIATTKTKDYDKRIKLAEKIKTEFLDFEKYQTFEFALEYAMTLANATAKMTDSKEIKDVAEKIKTEILDKYQTPEIAHQYSTALYNATIKMTNSNEIIRLAEKIKTEILAMEKYNTPEIARRYAMILYNATAENSNCDEIIRLSKKIKTEILDKYQTPEIALEYANALVYAAAKTTNSDEGVRLAEKIKTELLAYEKYQTPEIAEDYAMALCNAAIKMINTKKIDDIAAKIKEIADEYNTVEIHSIYADVKRIAKIKKSPFAPTQ